MGEEVQMTVGQLIAMLSKFDEMAAVFVKSGEYDINAVIGFEERVINVAPEGIKTQLLILLK